MTSQLNVDTIVDKAGTGGTNIKVGNDATYVGEGGSANSNNLVNVLPKAFNRGESNASIVDSSNISSGTDNGSGDYTYAFSNNMNNGSYGMVDSCQYAGISSFDHPELTTASYNVRIFTRADSLTSDDARNCQVITGDLA